ncbi:MAG: SEC-C domain-containing protein, partial [Candidatus Wildermuthbacteria bacterium]|nr:SEC-C domain-containing protein [Candidatus Wildermuthbacteria bacterium]
RAGVSTKEYEEKEREVGGEIMAGAAQEIALRTIDALWVDHLETMEELRDSVRLRAYGQRDPLVEYKNEGHRIFREFLLNIDRLVADALLHVQGVASAQEQPALADPAPSLQFSKVGRNDPCPCGSGKKYKKCHGT